jgi:hypothetical protein
MFIPLRHRKSIHELAGAAYSALLKKLIDDSLQYGENEKCLEKSTPVRFDPAYG